MQLAEKKCIPCSGATPRLDHEAVEKMRGEVPGWSLIGDERLHRTYKFPDFKTALDFVNRVGAVAEEEGHHPDLLLTWGKVEATIYTHAIGGLSESDFILAAKISKL